jgi:hypothetical protein
LQPTTGQVVTFTVSISLGSPRNGVYVEDIFAGGGRGSDTYYVPGSARFRYVSANTDLPIGEPKLLDGTTLNRVVYIFSLGSLQAGVYELTYEWRLSSKLGCYRYVSNEAHLDQTTVLGHLGTSTIGFLVRGCEGRTIAPYLSMGVPGLEAIFGEPDEPWTMFEEPDEPVVD